MIRRFVLAAAAATALAGAVGCEDGRGRDAGLADAGLADAGVDRTYDYCATSTECSMEQTCFEIRTSATAGAACARECSSDAVCERNDGFPGACLNVDGLGGIVQRAGKQVQRDAACILADMHHRVERAEQPAIRL